MRITRWTSILLLTGCSGPSAVVVAEPAGEPTNQPSQPSPTASTPDVAPAPIEQPAASAAATTAPVAGVAPPPGTDKRSCMMWQVCGCNHGCAAIAVAPSEVHEGLEATIVAGEHRGKKGHVIRSARQGGGETFVLSRNGPKDMVICDARASRAFIGYLCETSKSGPVPKDACAADCADLR